MTAKPRAVTLAVLLAIAGLCATTATAAARVPRGFIGVTIDGPLFSKRVDLEQEMALMASSGVESVRWSVFWANVEPYPDAASVPAAERGRFVVDGGHAYDFAATDRVVGAAARHGLQVMPMVSLAPAWARAPGSKNWAPPRDPATYAAFVGALVRRYKPGGTYWAQHTGRVTPITRWQVWNEPNGPMYWATRRGVATYARLLRPAHAAIKAADPRAKVVLAGLVKFSWRALRTLYRLGARRSFDVVALHPYTHRVHDVLRIIRLNRRVMRRHRDGRKRIMITEMTWPSAKGIVPKRYAYGFETTRRGQARNLRAAFTLLAHQRRRLRVTSAVWYSWMSWDANTKWSFDHAGLRTLPANTGAPFSKPALAALRRVARRLEGCAKTATGTCR